MDIYVILQTGYSVVSACVITLRWKDKTATLNSGSWFSTWHEGVICLVGVACCGFVAGLCYRFSASFIILVIAILIAVVAAGALYYRQVSTTLHISCVFDVFVSKLFSYFDFINHLVQRNGNYYALVWEGYNRGTDFIHKNKILDTI